ncbi:MAG: rhomboid family intramembrane serine protease [Acidobacteriia bacterium]|nr:rhomboid family intramembrane serine protease [Terriglobia bacterium]
MTIRSYGGGGGRGGGGLSLGFPPFTRAVKRLVIANASVYLLMLILGAVAPGLAGAITGLAALLPVAVAHGWIWQLVTYSFLHVGLFHVLFNMLTLWMFGSQLERDWGHRQFFEFYFYCAIAAALVTVGISYLGTAPGFGFLGIGPLTVTVGASGAIYGVMVAFAVLHGDQEFMLFPLPFMIKAKYLVGILLFISLAGAFQGMGPGRRGESVAYFAHLGGALLGWVYVRFLPRGGLRFGASERYFGIRNAYYRWKRRRAARKFEVYMRKNDRAEFFDEHGNYRPPDDKGNGESRRPPWVN